jgi:Mrp family chromosome partitioning ATPase
MSRNFQLLQRAELESNKALPQEVALSSTADATSPEVASSNIPCDAHSRISPEDISPEVFDLVQRLFLVPNDWTPRCVVFFSLGSSDGGSVCARAAEALSAHSSGTVCVVDANFTAPTMHELYSIENNVGFSDSLIQTDSLESYAHQIPETNLTIIPSGSNPMAWKSALASDTARQRLTDLRARFDYVLIEAPANSTVSSAMMLGQLADGAVIVLEANDTRREVARNAVDRLVASNVRILGAVLNNRRFPIPDRLYRAF